METSDNTNLLVGHRHVPSYILHGRLAGGAIKNGSHETPSTLFLRLLDLTLLLL